MTDQEALKAFQDARAALNKIADSDDASEAQVRKANQALQKLALDFARVNSDSVEARTAQFQSFIAQMEQVINGIGKKSTLAGLKQLQGVLDQARPLVAAASGGKAGGASPRG